jgi:hypothetical protein
MTKQNSLQKPDGINSKQKFIQVCKIEACDKEPTDEIKVGNQKYLFCCQKGFQKSLKDFLNKTSKI